MIIKPADDLQPQLDALRGLLTHPSADATKRKRIEQEIRNILAGQRGEAEVAYEMQVRYGDSPNWMVLHDLRVEHGGLVAQIDHLLMNRWLEIWVCESKHFSEGVAINEHGEFAAFFGGKPYGVPSPIEQNNRHMLVLKRLFDSGEVKLPKRLGFAIKPELKGLVLVSKNARISRPKAHLDGIEAVIKNDQLAKCIDKSLDDANPLGMAKLVGQDTLLQLAREIAALHKPMQFDWQAKFGLGALVSAPAAMAGQQPPEVAGQVPSQAPVPPADKAAAAVDVKPKQKLVCQACGVAVPYAVAKFCWFNKPKFGGNVYCMACQPKVAAR